MRRTWNALTWVGPVTPTASSATYELLLDLRLQRSPLIYVVRPHLEALPGEHLPHVYPFNTLCLYYGAEEWDASHPLADLVGWACEWLLFYEVWLASGEWLGGGIHLDTVTSNRAARRHGARQRVDGTGGDIAGVRCDRLRGALHRMYGTGNRTDDLLLHNAHLP